MAGKTEACAVNVARLDSPAFSKLGAICVSAANRTVINSAVLTVEPAVCLHQLLASDVLELWEHHIVTLSIRLLLASNERQQSILA